MDTNLTLTTIRSGAHQITDFIMPGNMNGVMLAREARRLQPKIRVLLTTGYADSSLERTNASGSEFDVIHKP
ncbi:hypothetical protein [Paraburkholderia hospita]|uniref:hypothetical protein n=1 Tax=Paraburkholderia hospita TaxID=169430 RepID=UPI003BF9F6E9